MQRQAAMHTVDFNARVHYTLLAGKVNASTFQPTTYCKDKGEACAAGTACCCDPTAPSALAAGGKCYEGYCLGVDKCSDASTGGDPLNVPAFLLGTNLDTGKTTGKVAICSMEPGPTTSPEACPWSIELGFMPVRR